MKNLLLLFICSFIANMGFAQIVENQVPMSQGNKNGYMIELPAAKAKDIEKSWSKFLKKYDGKTKKDKKSGEFKSDDAEIKAMSANTVDIYSKVIQRGDDCQLVVWYDLGGAFLTKKTHPDAYAAAKEMLDEYLLSTKIATTKDLLKEEESKLKKLNKEKGSLEKDKEGYEDDIKKYEEKIADAKKNIEQNIKDQAAKTEEIKTQGEKVKEVTRKLKKLEKGK